jgi:RNA polymerase sigma-70 factor (ECF subfamily)
MDSSDYPIAADLAAALPRLRRFARVLMGGGDGADDLVLETLAGARSGHAAGVELLTWLFGMMHAAHRRQARRPRRSAEVAVDAPAATPTNLCASVLQLPLEEREVLMLVAVERLSYTDVASVLGVQVATVMGTLTRARKRLSEMQS